MHLSEIDRKPQIWAIIPWNWLKFVDALNWWPEFSSILEFLVKTLVPYKIQRGTIWLLNNGLRLAPIKRKFEWPLKL